MFVQVIRGHVSDAEMLRRQMDRWISELRPGATGYLGTTAGVTSDGRSVAFARFESAEAARANSDRPEQGQWWAETEKCYSEPPIFEESSDVEEWMGGGSDDAGFVQFMRARVTDRGRLAELTRRLEEAAGAARPDLIGGVAVWTGPDTYTEAVYFTSEAEARAGESRQLPPDVQELMSDLDNVIVEIEYFDISEPWLHSA